MLPNVVSVVQTGPYRLRLRFDDGVEGELDFQSSMSFEGVFEPRILHTKSLPARREFDRGTYVLGALDQLAPGMLRYLGELRSGDRGARLRVRA